MRFFRSIVGAVCVVGASQSAYAWDSMERMQFASALANVLAAEESCGLAYDQEAVAGLIDKKVPADDLEFAGTLNLMLMGTKSNQAGLSGSAKTVLCTQSKRVARAYGFIK